MKFIALFLAAVLPAVVSAKVNYYNAVINGAQSDGCYDTEALGNAIASLRDGKLCVFLSYTGLSSPELFSHIHGPALVNQAADVIFTLSTDTNKAPAQGNCFEVDHKMQKDLDDGLWYFNIHTDKCPSGEIRGQIFPIAMYP